MSLESPGTIDMVVRHPRDSARVALVIYDGGEISDSAAREEALQKKLAAYLLFVSSGQFGEAYPQLVDAEPYIAVVCRVPPTEGMRQIEGLHNPRNPAVVLGVEVVGDAEFRAKIA